MENNLLNDVSPDSQDSVDEVSSEIQEYTAESKRRRQLFPRAALVGLGAGLVAALFRAALTGADALRNQLLIWSHNYLVLGWIFPMLLSITGAVISVMLVRHFAPEASGSGVPHLEGVMHRLRTLNWKRVLPVKFIAGALSIGSGLALGREGPTVQMGASIGDAVSRWFKSLPRERQTLIAAGGGAGLAAAFNAPLAGVVFVLEEIQRDFQPLVFGAAFLASAIADIVVSFLFGGRPVFNVPNYQTPPLASLPVFAILGVLAGLLGVAFNRSLLGTVDLFSAFGERWRLGIAAGVGAIVGLIGWFAPIAIGDGHALAELVLAGEFALASIPLFFITRFFLSVSSYGTGTAGGIFAPLLTLGALLGLAIGQIAHFFAPAVVPEPAVFAVVGMAAYFAAIVRAPLTGIVLILEMTGDYQQMLPLLVCCFCAYAVAELMKDLPIYEALLERDLLRDHSHTNLKRPMVIEVEVEEGASFAGREIRMLGLPSGVVLIRCVEGGREFVPMASTRLEAHMKITAVIAPEATNGLDVLRHGCKAGKKRNS